MESYLNQISNCCSNPFIVGFIIIFVLNIIVYFIPTKNKNGKISYKKLFRSGFYQYIVITFILYIHHNRIYNEFKSNFESELKLDLVSKTGSSEDMLEPILNNTIPVQSTEDDFI